VARDVLGLDDATLAAIAATSIRASGAPASLKSAALHGVDRWLREPSPVIALQDHRVSQVVATSSFSERAGRRPSGLPAK
jgi:hypothetical protein